MQTNLLIEKHLLDFFNGDMRSVRLWMETPNPLLGEISPNDFVSSGREEKLLEFIESQIDEKTWGDDAMKWAKGFRRTAIRLGYPDMDEDWLFGWFANAIESGIIRRKRREKEQNEVCR